jgi:hypothetical protein
MDEFVEAAQKTAMLDPWYIRDRALERYSFDAVLPQYRRYFERISVIHDPASSRSNESPVEVMAVHGG